MDYAALAAAIVAAIILEKLFEAVFGPLWKQFAWPNIYKFYAAMVIGTALGVATGLNALPVFTAAPLAGRALTALLIGVGPSILYDLLDKVPQPKLPVS
jgi:hypothetical protein